MSAQDQSTALDILDGLDNTDLSTVITMDRLFSKQNMTEAITQLSKFLDPKPSESDIIPFDYTKFSIMNKLRDEFIQEFLLKGAVSSPEMMLLVVETITRSGEGVKRAVFRFDKENKMSGGKVIFVKWLAFVIDRIDSRYKSGDVPTEDEARVEEMVAESIMELIRSFTVIHKEKQLNVLTTKFEVDWDSIVQKTMKFALLHKMDSLVESCKRAQEHVKNIKEGSVQPYEPRPLPEKLITTGKERLLSQKQQVVEIIVDDDESMDKNGHDSLENHNQTASKSDAEVSVDNGKTEPVESEVVGKTSMSGSFWSDNHQTAWTSSQGWGSSTAGSTSNNVWSAPSLRISTGGWDTFVPSVNSANKEQDVVTSQDVKPKESYGFLKVTTGGWDNYNYNPETQSNEDKGRKSPIHSTTDGEYTSDKSVGVNGFKATTNGSLNQKQLEDSSVSRSDSLLVSYGRENNDNMPFSSIDNREKFRASASTVSDDSRKRRGGNDDSGGKDHQKRSRTKYDATTRTRNQGRGIDRTRPAWMTTEQIGSNRSVSGDASRNDGRGRGRGRGREYTLPAWKTKQDQMGPAGEGKERANDVSTVESTSYQSFEGKSSNHIRSDGLHSDANLGRLSSIPEWSSKQQNHGPSAISESSRLDHVQIPQASINNNATSHVSLGRGRGRTMPAWMTSSSNKSSATPSFQESYSSDLKRSNQPMPQSTSLPIPQNGIGRDSGRGRGREKTLPAWMTKK